MMLNVDGYLTLLHQASNIPFPQILSTLFHRILLLLYRHSLPGLYGQLPLLLSISDFIFIFSSILLSLLRN